MAYSKGTLAGEFIEGVVSELNGVIGIGVVDITESLAMDTYSVRKEFDPDVASSHMYEVIRAQQETLKALRVNDSIKDMLITMDTQVHFLTLSKTGKALFYVVVDTNNANLSIMRSVIRKYAKGI